VATPLANSHTKVLLRYRRQPRLSLASAPTATAPAAAPCATVLPFLTLHYHFAPSLLVAATARPGTVTESQEKAEQQVVCARG